MNNKRKAELERNGVDTSKFFTITVNEDIPKGTTMNIDMTFPELRQKITEDGYVRNTKLHRRWITAHYLHMLNDRGGWYQALNRYPYMYQLEMMREENRILDILRCRDLESYNERSKFFTMAVMRHVMCVYIEDCKRYLKTLPSNKRCKGKPYVTIPGRGYVFTDELDVRYIEPLTSIGKMIERCTTHKDIEAAFVMLDKYSIKLPYNYPTIKWWINAFQSEGAYYTLMNLVKFHDCVLPAYKNYNEVRPETTGERAVYTLNFAKGDRADIPSTPVRMT